jgi:hypothetical protein
MALGTVHGPTAADFGTILSMPERKLKAVLCQIKHNIHMVEH